MPVKTVIQLRRDTAANWASTNPVLASGEAGLETDTNKTKYGNGSTAWNSLAYSASGLKVSDTAPTGATTGDMWLDSTSGKTFVYYDSYWVETSSNNKGADGRYTVADAAPLSPTTGDTWFNSTNGKQYVYMDSFWVEPNSNLAGVQGNAGPQANVNAIINGAFDIWQRGTSFSVGTNFIYGPDRWMANRGALAAGMSVSRQAVNDTTNLPNIRYAMRIQRDSGNTGTTSLGIATTLETADSIAFTGKTITFSYYVRAGSNYSGGNFTGALAYGTGVDQNVNYGFTGQTVIINTSVALTSSTTTWQRVTGTATVPTNATQIGLYALYNPTGTAGANDWVEITGVQLEAGAVATPFRRNAPSIQAELAACQRYYYRMFPQSTFAPFGTGIASSSTIARIVIKPPVTPRTTPNSIDWSNIGVQDSVNVYAATTATIQNGGSDTFTIDFSGITGLTQYRPYIGHAQTNTGYLGIGYEL